MMDLPQSTLFNRRIPKQKFYDKLSVTPQLKRIFIGQINTIYWRNKIAPYTVNIASGEYVTEIEVFEIRLNQRGLDKRLLQLIDKEIPYHILFLLTYENETQAWISYKEESRIKSGAFKPGAYYYTEWMLWDELSLDLSGLNMDAVYENFIRQVAGKRLESSANMDIKQDVANDERRQKLQKKIMALEKKVLREKQFNVHVALNADLRRLRKELEELE